MGGKEKRLTQEGAIEQEWHVDSAHLDDFVIAAVRFLRVQVYKTDLRGDRKVKMKHQSQCEDYSTKAE